MSEPKLITVWKSGDKCPFFVAICEKCGPDPDGNLLIKLEHGNATIREWSWFHHHELSEANVEKLKTFDLYGISSKT